MATPARCSDVPLTRTERNLTPSAIDAVPVAGARAPCSSIEAALERAWLSEVRLAGILGSPSGRFRMSRHLVNIVYRIDGQSLEIGQNRLP
jgi:hypothetical protein